METEEARRSRADAAHRWKVFVEHTCMCGLLPLRHLLRLSAAGAGLRELTSAAAVLLPAVEFEQGTGAQFKKRLDKNAVLRILHRVGGRRTRRVCLDACCKFSAGDLLEVTRLILSRFAAVEMIDVSRCERLARMGAMWLAIEQEVRACVRDRSAGSSRRVLAVSWESALDLARNGGTRGQGSGGIPRSAPSGEEEVRRGGGGVRLLLGDLDDGVPPALLDLHRGAQGGVMPVLNLLLSIEVPAGDGAWRALDVNGQVRNGDRALHAACRRAGNAPAIQLLIHAAADVNALGHDKETPLHRACSRKIGDIAMVRLLLQHGALVDAKDRDKDTSLHRALRLAEAGKRRAIVGALLERGACVNKANARRELPLHVACELGDTELARSLIRHGADIEGSSVFAPAGLSVRHGSRPIHVASRFGHRDILEMLLAEGAQAEAADGLGWTALSLARAQECRDLLAAAGLDWRRP